jgi:hypothetical protein
MPYAVLVESMLRATRVRDLLGRDSLDRTLERAKLEAEQVAADHPVWAGATRLFPEIFDGLRRAELADLGQLPDWARDRDGID